LATLSTSSIEEAMAVATGPVWFQLYVFKFKDREITTSLVQRAEVAGSPNLAGVGTAMSPESKPNQNRMFS
jgi:isopentenyl diphosphate isomerase/L-lactate dehydrogenase-like FMN-dependent dehydrogenase